MLAATQQMERLIPTETPIRVVDLGALELVGVVDVEGFPFGVEIDGGDCGFAVAVAGFLSAAEGQVSFGADGWRVDVDDAGEQVANGVKGAVHVARVDRGREAVGTPLATSTASSRLR